VTTSGWHESRLSRRTPRTGRRSLKAQAAYVLKSRFYQLAPMRFVFQYPFQTAACVFDAEWIYEACAACHVMHRLRVLPLNSSSLR
jgi:hypothetical protein